MQRAGYLALAESGELHHRAEDALKRLECCTLCPRQCQVNRLAGEHGFCRTGRRAVVASAGPHFGEEGVLTGTGGSGTIFFTHCNLRCTFCQNWEISQGLTGEEAEPGGLARLMLQLQASGCHNINLVTPSHVIPQLLEALILAAGQGLELPLVFNTGGYDDPAALQLLEGVVDIYLPDFKFWGEEYASRCFHAAGYRSRACAALQEMHRQTGDLVLDRRGIAVRGLLVRHLIMPGATGDAARIFQFLADEISPGTWLNLMGQYRPCGLAGSDPCFYRRPCPEEIQAAVRAARTAGLVRLDPGSLAGWFAI